MYIEMLMRKLEESTFRVIPTSARRQEEECYSSRTLLHRLFQDFRYLLIRLCLQSAEATRSEQSLWM